VREVTAAGPRSDNSERRLTFQRPGADSRTGSVAATARRKLLLRWLSRERETTLAVAFPPREIPHTFVQHS